MRMIGAKSRLSLTESELPTPKGRARQKAIASTEQKRLEQIR